jgi:hypothetical protein
MHITLRLAELARTPEQKDKRGLIAEIQKHTGLERHKIAAVLHNKAEYLSRTTLAKLCEYLVLHRNVDPRLLPGSLFQLEPDTFWSLLASRDLRELCLGTREDESGESFVMESDCYLLGRLLHGVFAQTRSTAKEGSVAPPGQHFEQRLVPAPHEQDSGPQRIAQQVYREFAHQTRDRALLCLGSIKVNGLMEPILASTFSAKAFVSQDGVARAGARSSPIFLRYRDSDVKPASCCGGMQLSVSEAARRPGIYFEKASGHWECCPWIANKQDAALVCYAWRPPEGRLDMVLCGFSGKATRFLADLLLQYAEEFWPPSYSTEQLAVGAFVVKILSPLATTSFPAISKEEFKVIPLDEAVLRRRLGGAKGRKASAENGQPTAREPLKR